MFVLSFWYKGKYNFPIIQIFFDFFQFFFQYLIYIQISFAFFVCFTYHDMTKKQLCKYLCVLLLSFVVLTFASVKTVDTTTRPHTRIEPCEFLAHEFLDVNF